MKASNNFKLLQFKKNGLFCFVFSEINDLCDCKSNAPQWSKKHKVPAVGANTATAAQPH